MPNWSLIRRTKRNDASASNGQLPTELWAIIINIVLAEFRQPYLYCTPETFPQYHVLLHNVDNVNKILASNDWKSIRAVCHKWKALAGAKPYFFIGKPAWSGDPPPEIPLGTSSVFVDSRANAIIALESIAHLGATLTTLAFGHSYGSEHEFINKFLDNSSSFPNLQCLSLHSTNTRKSFWKTMQTDFPNLVSLTVRSKAHGVPGRYVLRNLEILEIDDWQGFQLVCPSLKHLSIRFSNSFTVHEFLVDHGHQLESFIADPYPPTMITNPKDFWFTTFPHVVTFGKRIRMEPRTCSSRHPLRHLLLTSDHNSLRPETILAEIDNFPGIESVHIGMADLRTGTANELRRRCRRRGVRIVEIVDGKKVFVQPPRRFSTLIKEALILITFPCWWFCIPNDAWEHD